MLHEHLLRQDINRAVFIRQIAGGALVISNVRASLRDVGRVANGSMTISFVSGSFVSYS